MPAPILVVDDEKNIRLTVKQALESADQTVVTAINAEDAMQKLTSTPISLILLDLRLPGTNGLELFKHIRDRYPRIPVIIISAHATVQTAVDTLKEGAVDFLQKPFSPKQLRSLVRQVLQDSSDETAAP